MLLICPRSPQGKGSLFLRRWLRACGGKLYGFLCLVVRTVLPLPDCHTWRRSGCVLKCRHCKGPQILTWSQQRASLHFFKFISAFQNLRLETASGNRQSGYYNYYYFLTGEKADPQRDDNSYSILHCSQVARFFVNSLCTTKSKLKIQLSVLVYPILDTPKAVLGEGPISRLLDLPQNISLHS